MSQHGRLGPARLYLGARLFGVALLTAPILLTRDNTAMLALLALALVWVAAAGAELLRAPRKVAFIVEGAVIGAICALSLDASPAVLGALAVPPFTAALSHGLRGVALTLSAQLTTLVAVSTLWYGRMDNEQGSMIFTWVLTALGLGLIGTFVRSTTAPDPLAPYRVARALLRELNDLSGGLGSGLDPLSLGRAIAGIVRNELPVTALAIHVPRGQELVPLLSEAGDGAIDLDVLEDRALEARRTLTPHASGHTFAVPLLVNGGFVAVVTGQLPATLEPDVLRLAPRLASLAARLEPSAVHLDTALLFSAFRDAATSQERRRVARELHDGIAQDIASLGYLVDALAAHPASPDQAERLRILRERVTAVVSDVRLSVQTLRTDVGAGDSLGTAVAAVARHLSESSGTPIQVTADERTTRLRPEVEAELFRIVQEALTNAVRHAAADQIEVRCRVAAPFAEIVVRDDGVGLQPGRADSFGIEIMHERARLIGAVLHVSDAAPRGTVVTVAVGTDDRRVGTARPRTDQRIPA